MLPNYLDKLNVYNKPNDFISLNYNCGLVKYSHPLKAMKNVSNVWRETINNCPNGYCFENNQKLGKTMVIARESLLSETPQWFAYTAVQCGEFLKCISCFSLHEILCNLKIYFVVFQNNRQLLFKYSYHFA